MRISKLYLKLFLSFILVLLVTEAVILGLFFAIAGREFHEHLDRFIQAQAEHMRLLVEERLMAEPDTPVAQNRLLEDYLEQVGRLYDARVWLEDEQGRVLLAPLGSGPPPGSPLEFDEPLDLGNARIWHAHEHDGWGSLVAIDVLLPDGGQGTVHFLTYRERRYEPEQSFAVGLLAIGAVVALLVIPVFRLLTRPLKRLTASALRVAQGDLSHRAQVDTRDEIGDLGRAFNRMAESLERQIRSGRELTAHVSHELRTPLTRMRMAQELLRDGLPDQILAKAAPRLAAMEADMEELDRLIGRILELSKLDLEDQRLAPTRINATQLMDDILGRYAASMEQRSLKFVRNYLHAKDIFINADRELIDTLLCNMADNAVRYAPESSAVTARITMDSDWVELALANGGKALSDQDLENMFKPFQRLGRQDSGSGLGLAIARRIAQRHGGDLVARNIENGLEVVLRMQRA